MWVRTMVPPGAMLRTRDVPKPTTEPSAPRSEELIHALRKVRENSLDVITGTTITAEMRRSPVIVIETDTINATAHIKTTCKT